MPLNHHGGRGCNLKSASKPQTEEWRKHNGNMTFPFFIYFFKKAYILLITPHSPVSASCASQFIRFCFCIKFLLHLVIFCFYWHTNHTSARCKKLKNALLYFDFFFRIHWISIQVWPKMKICIKTGGWKHTSWWFLNSLLTFSGFQSLFKELFAW